MWLKEHFHPIVLAKPERLVAPLNWQEHIPFAMWLIAAFRPTMVVELGTHTGNSYCAMCQAVYEQHCDTQCYAVDSWVGDEQAGYYGDHILQELREHHDPRYSMFSRLIRSTFDEALPHFSERSIDLLHIDGLHTYEAVDHDFHTWLPKMSARGIVVFHDINVRGDDFGVHRLWDELQLHYPHFAFHHGHGLGVLAVGDVDTPALAQLFALPPTEAADVRRFFYQLGSKLTFEAENAVLRADVAERDQRIIGIFEKSKQDVDTYRNWLAERDQMIQDRNQQAAKLGEDINILHGFIRDRDTQLSKQTADIELFKGWVEERDELLGQQNKHIAQQNQELARLTEVVSFQQATINERDQEIDARNKHIEELFAYAKETADELGRLQSHVQEIQRSLGWQVLNKVWRVRNRVVPPDSLVSRGLRIPVRAARIMRHEGPRSLLQRGVRRLRRAAEATNDGVGLSSQLPQSTAADEYQQWIAAYEPDALALERQRAQAAALTYKPPISVLTPVYNPAPAVIEAMIESVLAQTYTNWELWLINASPENTGVRVVLERAARRDSRVHVRTLPANGGIVANTNVGLALAQGEFVAFVDHDDTLAPFALYEITCALNKRPDADLLYSDSDLLSADGTRRFQPLLKPDWSPAIMLSANYATHLCVARTQTLHTLGGLTPGSDGAQDWDLMLRLSEQSSNIVHIPKILYHWREGLSSTATDIKQKPYAMSAQLTVIAAHLRRQGLAADAFFDTTGYIRVAWPLPRRPLVSIIIPSRNVQLVHQCISSILTRTSYRDFEILVVDTSKKEEIVRHYSQRHNPVLRILTDSRPFNYSRVNNLAAREAKGEMLLFLNDDTLVIDSEWLTEMVRWAMLNHIGVVGAKLLMEDGLIQHAGVVVGLDGFAGHPFAGCHEGFHSVYGCTEWYRNYSAVTSACLMVRRALFEQVGGFDESLSLCGNDVELCLRIGAHGYRVFYTPFARLRHLENATRGKSIDTIPKSDFANSYRHYHQLLIDGDPYYNANLSMWSSIPRLRMPQEVTSLDFVHTFLAQQQISIDDQIPDEGFLKEVEQ